MPLDVVLTTATGKTTRVVWLAEKQRTLVLPSTEAVTAVAIDAEGWVLKTLGP